MESKKKLSYITAEEYLANEECASIKHEFVDGQVYAMTGATGRHRKIAGNIYSALRSHLKGSGCHADIADAMVHVQHTNSYYYPDVLVSCGSFDEEAMLVESPVLIVEVLSRSTAAIDRREKLYAYKRLNSLREYLIVHQRTQKVELHRKNAYGEWELYEFTQDAVSLESLPIGKIVIPLEVIYEDVDWTNKSGWQVSEDSPLAADEVLDW